VAEAFWPELLARQQASFSKQSELPFRWVHLVQTQGVGRSFEEEARAAVGVWCKISITVEKMVFHFFIAQLGRMHTTKGRKISAQAEKYKRGTMVQLPERICVIVSYINRENRHFCMRERESASGKAFGRPQRNPELKCCPHSKLNADQRPTQ